MSDVIAPEVERGKLVAGDLEFAMLVWCVLEPALRATTFHRFDEKHFASDSSNAIFHRLKNLTKAGKTWPSLDVLAKDPVLPHGAQLQLKALLSRLDRGRPLTAGSVTVGDKVVPLTSAADFEGYVFDVLDKYKKLRLTYEYIVQGMTESSSGDVLDPLEAFETMQAAAAKVLGLHTDEDVNAHAIHFGAGTTPEEDAFRDQVFDEMANPTVNQKFPTGIHDYDVKAGGFVPGEVVLLGSVSGGGKTAAMLSLMNNFTAQGISCAMLQLELAENQYAERSASDFADINSAEIRANRLTEDDKAKLKKFRNRKHEALKKAKARHSVFCLSQASIHDLELMFSQHDYKVWFIDYVNLLKECKVDGDNDGWKHLSGIIKEFKRIAKKRKVVIVCAVQVRFDPETGVVEVRYAKAMVDHADVVITWYVPKEERDGGVVWWRHLKARQYDIFDFPMKVELQYGRFVGFAPGEVMAKDNRKLDGNRPVNKADGKVIAFAPKKPKCEGDAGAVPANTGAPPKAPKAIPIATAPEDVMPRQKPKRLIALDNNYADDDE